MASAGTRRGARRRRGVRGPGSRGRAVGGGSSQAASSLPPPPPSCKVCYVAPIGGGGVRRRRWVAAAAARGGGGSGGGGSGERRRRSAATGVAAMAASGRGVGLRTLARAQLTVTECIPVTRAPLGLLAPVLFKLKSSPRPYYFCARAGSVNSTTKHCRLSIGCPAYRIARQVALPAVTKLQENYNHTAPCTLNPNHPTCKSCGRLEQARPRYLQAKEYGRVRPEAGPTRDPYK